MFYMPTRIVHGLGSAEALPAQVKAAGGSKAFVCTDKGLTAAGVTAAVTAHLDAAGVPYVALRRGRGRPRRPHRQCRGRGVHRRAAAIVVVALGGGSPMCAGKGIALVAANGGTLTDYEGFNKAAGQPHPVIAMPTTAGSGTEVSRVTILTDEARNFKMSILDERTYPDRRHPRRRAHGDAAGRAGAGGRHGRPGARARRALVGRRHRVLGRPRH